MAKVLCTGGTGFLGSYVVNNLRSKGIIPYAPSSSEFDLRERNEIRLLLDKVRPDIIIHAAGIVGGIGANKANPAGFFYDNAIMGLQLIEEARKHGVEKVVVIGTTCSYPKFTAVPFKEEDLWNGYPEETNAPYALAKKMLLVQAQAYREQYGMNIVYVLPVNLYGPGDNFDLETSHVVPALIRKSIDAVKSKAKTLKVWGTGTSTRDFIYVEDCADAIVRVMQSYNDPCPLNIGSGIEVSIIELIALIAKIVGFNGTIEWDSNKPDGQPRRCVDISKAVSLLGFRATTELEAGLRKTVRWYIDHYDQQIRNSSDFVSV